MKYHNKLHADGVCEQLRDDVSNSYILQSQWQLRWDATFVLQMMTQVCHRYKLEYTVDILTVQVFEDCKKELHLEYILV